MFALTQIATGLANARGTISQVYLWLGIIVVLAFVLGFAALWLRRRLIDQRDDQPPMGFTLKDLRAMHAAGQLSDEELAAAEEKALSRTRSLYLGDEDAKKTDAVLDDEPEDLGHLSTDFEDDLDAGAENIGDVSDKNPDDEPKA